MVGFVSVGLLAACGGGGIDDPDDGLDPALNEPNLEDPVENPGIETPGVEDEGVDDPAF